MTQNPHESTTVKGEAARVLIDSMRWHGSYEAARYGATDESSLFNEQHQRDFEIRGNSYDFTQTSR